MDEKIKAFWEQLKTERDELRVQMHLASAELKDEWEVAEKKWAQAQKKLDVALKEAGDKAREARDTLSIVGDELGDAYGRIRDRLNDKG
ncbi:MAG: hypothetical protein KDI19_03680 [Pseudomonadales bacterium]|nr:hypothetical protein [Pseudomonadales bacterium]